MVETFQKIFMVYYPNMVMDEILWILHNHVYKCILDIKNIVINYWFGNCLYGYRLGVCAAKSTVCLQFLKI